MKTCELTGYALNWVVAKCEGIDLIPHRGGWTYASYSTDWAQGGPIIEREKIAIKENGYGHWFAKVGARKWMRGPTPLIAAMRCFVASKFNDDIEIPKELT